ncbi:trypsin-like serine protease [Arsenicicoccus sp. MKL-02]|uniref:Trypsin-like serine protease n=1 Tax=Arsenicicoccus cauae TaxID=2663847 RepID=A0A6I3IGR9_9MICO|nr:trypsin-like peptidase domain-containing protein [Arsenicicoccus cauae]MTB70955.1 trypsin-like serine protease [Arsenicicoccus cauae]
MNDQHQPGSQPPLQDNPRRDPVVDPRVDPQHTQEIPRHSSTQEIPRVVQPGTSNPYAAPSQPSQQGDGPGGGGPGGSGPAYGPVGGSAPVSPRRRRAGWWQVPTAAVAAAALASGGTYALFAGDRGQQTSSVSRTTPSANPARNTQAPLDQGASNAPDWKATAQAVSPSVVSISVQSGSSGGEGSGVILDEQGHIVTNNHVVGDSGSGAQIVVTLDDQRAFQAKIVGLDPSTDLAVIKLQGDVKDLKPIAIGNSDQLTVGDPVMAVGNPLGLSGTVTTGIVSALNRPVSTDRSSQDQQDGGLFGQQAADPVVTNAIQTSAPINPGNSGGALVNADGQLIGINSSIASMGSSSGGQAGSIGIGFAIPVNEVNSITDQLIKTGRAQHPFMGVSSKPAMVKDGDGQRVAAVIANVVSGSPADKAGLRAQDAIIAIDDEPVTGSLALVAQVRERTVGDTAKVTYLRDGERHDVQITFAQKSSQ